MKARSNTPLRVPSVGPRDAVFSEGPGGVRYVRSPHPLQAYPRCLTDRLSHWAEVRPQRIYLAQRASGGPWRTVSYAEAWARVQRIGQSLLDRGLSADRPVVILSENSIEHALLGLAALHVGVLYSPISPAYSIISRDHERLRHAVNLLQPGLVYAEDGERYRAAIQAVVASGTEVVVNRAAVPGRACTSFSALEQQAAGAGVAAAHAGIDPDSAAKILFTSGSTAQPKGVINTHRMLSCNQQMQLQAFSLYGQDPLVLVDWQPWHHTAGGNANFGTVLYNGGSMYIDEGKPIPGAVEETVRNLREISPTVYISVPRGYEMLIPYLRQERPLRENFFGRLRMLFYAGAGLSQHVWDELEDLALEACGERIPIMTSLGSTETGPFAFAANWDIRDARSVGLPASSLEVKLVPNGEKMELRLRGPNITPGYWRAESITRAAFDEEGYYRMGDALKFLDPAQPLEGLLFDGRVVEDFKLSTGTWVHVGAMRVQVIQHCAPLVQDAVIAGHDRDYMSVLIVPNLIACAALAGDLGPAPSVSEVLGSTKVRVRFQELADSLCAAGTGSSNRVERMMLLEVPPSLDLGEITDKGSLSQRAMLAHRAALVEELYAEPPSPKVIVARR